MVVVGVGGLGAPAASLLAAGGARRLRLIDDDHVEVSNLPRQPLYATGDIGRPKVDVAAQQLWAVRPDLEIDLRPTRLDERNWPELLAGAAVVIDGSDGFATKALLNRATQSRRVPLIHAGVLGLDGQLCTILPGETACLACLFPLTENDDDMPTCQQAGVLAPVVGAIGFAAAREALAVLAGRPPPLAGRLGILDGRRLRWRSLALQRAPHCLVCGTA